MVGFEGPGVNDAPVERQSRPRPSPQARIESHRFRHITTWLLIQGWVVFFYEQRGFEGPGVNETPVEPQSRPRPSREARIESPMLHHKRTLILIQRSAFFLSRKTLSHMAFRALLGARGVFLCVFQFSWVLRRLAGCKIKRQTCFRFIANLTIVSSINFQNQAHGKSNKLQLTNPGCALVISRQHSSMQAPLCLESDFLHG